MINKTLITLVILFTITGCGSSQEQDGLSSKINNFLTISQNNKQETPKEEQKYHAQCSVGNIVTDEIVTDVKVFGTLARYVNADGKTVVYVSNCKITQL